MCRRISIAFIALILSNWLTAQSLLEHFTEKDGLPGLKVYAAVQGEDGNIWFATSDGISTFNGLQFQNYSQAQGIPQTEFIGVAKDHFERIWTYSSAGNIYYQENSRFTPLALPKEYSQLFSEKIINSMLPVSRNEVWVSTVIGGGLYKVEYGNQVEQTSELGATSYYLFDTGEGMISGSHSTPSRNNKLQVVTTNNWYTVSLSGQNGYGKSSVTQLMDRSLLYAKDHELVNLSKAGVVARAFVEKSIQHVMQDREGQIWVSLYQGGTLCYPDGNIESGKSISYLGGKTVSSVCEDNSGNIWLCTLGDGVYYLPARQWMDYTEPTVFSSTDPDRVEEIQASIISEVQPLVAEESDFRVLSTESARYDTIPPAIYISGVQIMGNDTVVQDTYRLAYDQNFIKISYVGFAYNNPEILQYKFMLEGIDSEPVYTNNTFAQYTTLPPGEYRFFVSAMNKNGYWSERPAIIYMGIRQPFWSTWWFIGGLIAAGLLLLGGSVFLFVRNVRKRERQKVLVNKRIADIELQALRSQMNPHFIFNTLSSIQHYITTSDTESALKYLSKFAQLMRKIMENSKQPMIPLKAELDALKLYLELEAMRFEGKFDYTIGIDDSIDVNYEEIPAMLIQPYAENALLHGIRHKEGGGHLTISLSKTNGMLNCTVQDDGIGREESRKINAEKNRSHQSMGMSITKERLQIINEQHGSKLNVNVVDLKENGQAAGTKVELFIPS